MILRRVLTVKSTQGERKIAKRNNLTLDHLILGARSREDCYELRAILYHEERKAKNSAGIIN